MLYAICESHKSKFTGNATEKEYRKEYRRKIEIRIPVISIKLPFYVVYHIVQLIYVVLNLCTLPSQINHYLFSRI